jgi:hypothetical protein
MIIGETFKKKRKITGQVFLYKIKGKATVRLDHFLPGFLNPNDSHGLTWSINTQA